MLSKLGAATSDGLGGDGDLLAARKRLSTRGELERPEKSLGMRHCPEGVLRDIALRPYVRPAEAYVFDPMHTAFSYGFASLEVHRLVA